MNQCLSNGTKMIDDRSGMIQYDGNKISVSRFVSLIFKHTFCLLERDAFVIGNVIRDIIEDVLSRDLVSPHCFIYGLLYFNHFVKNTGTTNISRTMYYKTYVSAVMLASKMYEEKEEDDNRYYSSMLDCIITDRRFFYIKRLKEDERLVEFTRILNYTELKLLDVIEYKLFVRLSEVESLIIDYLPLVMCWR